jgi:class 3 adenylate cyclase
MAINSKALSREKRRTERLIREMLPSLIAYKMMKNTKVEAEFFESVTVFFSDIVDFADISTASSPYDIVAFLNGIYNLIDSRLQWFDVYKVETIGCTYMVVSGLPLRNGSRHASEIAKMALDIMSETENLGVLHMPYRRILLRIGAHTGWYPYIGAIIIVPVGILYWLTKRTP